MQLLWHLRVLCKWKPKTGAFHNICNAQAVTLNPPSFRDGTFNWSKDAAQLWLTLRRGNGLQSSQIRVNIVCDTGCCDPHVPARRFAKQASGCLAFNDGGKLLFLIWTKNLWTTFSSIIRLGWSHELVVRRSFEMEVQRSASIVCTCGSGAFLCCQGSS